MDTATPARILVLIVEDEVILLQEAADHFRDAGFDVIEAASAEQAMVELSDGHDFGVLFTDINLGGKLTGWEIAEVGRLMWPGIVVVYASGQLADKSRLVEGSRFFTKPYHIQEIGDVCRVLCSDTPPHRALAGGIGR